MDNMTRLFKFNKFGIAEDPIGAQITWTVGNRRTYLADVIGCYRHETTGITMLKIRHFNGEPMTDVVAAVVRVLVRS